MGKKRRKRQQSNLLVLKLLILVVLVLIVFEGRLIYTMFTQSSRSAVTTASPGSVDPGAAHGSLTQEPATEQTASVSAAGSKTSVDVTLSGLGSSTANKVKQAKQQTEAIDDGRISEIIDSPKVMKETTPPVDDSYFSNAVFIGDSRMMGFRNASGITQGDFLTSVGLSTEAMNDAVIDTVDGKISVYQGLSGKQYDYIYLMLGTNDLGYYPWEMFKPNFQKVIDQFHKLQPNAVIYICSVIYVEEAKISTSYDNNENVRKINQYLLEVCEENSFCYYINLNEIFSNGYGSLIEGASSDGIHLYEIYCQQMLDYLRTHYVINDNPPSSDRKAETSASDSETETEGNAG